MTGHWSLGLVIGLPLLALLFLALVGLAIWLMRLWREEDAAEAAVVGGVLAVAALVVLVGAVFGYFPYKASYHRWEPKVGTVAAVSGRFLSDGNGGTNQRFAVRFTSGPELYGCDDTRCSILKPGDHLTLSCKKEYQWSSEPGYGCRWGGVA